MLLKTLSRFVILIGAFLAGYGIKAWQDRKGNDSVSDRWLTKIPGENRQSFSNSVFMEMLTDNLDPHPEILETQAKLVAPLGQDIKDHLAVAYIAEVRIGSVGAKTPSENTNSKGGRFEMKYVGQLNFELFDKDGFRLVTVLGQEHVLPSGSTSKLQEITASLVPVALAGRVVSFSTGLSLLRSWKIEKPGEDDNILPANPIEKQINPETKKPVESK